MADVLVVDDSLTMRRAVARTLEGAGYACDLAENGAEGLRMALAGNYQLVISDLQMPVMGGLNFITALRSKGKTRDVKVMVLTSEPEASSVEQAAKLGVKGYVLKPVRPEMVLERVLPLLSRG